MLITSLDNDRIKGYIKLKERKYRKKTNTFIVEGLHSVLEAYKTITNIVVITLLLVNTFKNNNTVFKIINIGILYKVRIIKYLNIFIVTTCFKLKS